MRHFFMRTMFFGAAIVGLAGGLSLGTGCLGGGCPWTKVSPVTVAPATSCLTVTVENADGSGSNGGCDNPDLKIINACTDDLVIDGTNLALLGADGTPIAQDPGPVTVAAGKTGVVEVTLDTENPEVLHAKLGSAALELSFSTSK